jgi:putative ABC transport system substrate-binding protein
MGAATVAAPAVVRAQQAKKLPTVGYLWHAGSPKEESPYYEALIEGFSKLGYVHGQNINLLHRFPNEIPDRFRSMAAELVSLNADVLMGGAIGSSYLRDATTTIPIVFMFVPDPVGMKLAKSFANPGGNITGLSNFGREIAGKRLQLLKELVPGLKRVGLLTNLDLQTNRVFVEVMGEAARQLELTLLTFDARSVAEMEPAFDAMAKAGIQAMTPVQGGTSFQGRDIIPKLALVRHIAMCAYSRETFEFGALVSYGPDQVEMCRRSAVFADKILKGAKPADIPIEQPSSFEFLINLKTAKALGLEVPLSHQQLANEVVE